MKLRKIVLIWLLLIIGFLFFLALRLDFIHHQKLAINFTPRQFPNVKSNHMPALTAKSYVIIDVNSGKIISQKNPHLRLHPASITKMVTAINALESYPLSEVITVKQEYPIGKNMGLEAGEKITVKNLIYGLLVHSANDAAFVLGGQDDISIDIFIARMNNFVKHLDLTNTNFVNFDGEDAQNHYSTAYDLAHLARFALKNKVFEQAVGKQQMTVYDVNGEIMHQLETTNELLSKIPEVKGIKTGWTPTAGECFVGLIELDGHQLVTVILGSQDRFGETEMLIDWSKKNVEFITAAIPGGLPSSSQ